MKHPRLIGLYSSRPQCGKSTVAGILAWSGYTVHPFVGPLKRLTIDFITQFGLEQAQASYYVYKAKEAPIEGIPGEPTARHLMQTLGTEWGRELVHRDVWLDMWKSSLPQGAVVVDDMRFNNEARAIKDLGGEWWRVVRPGHEGETNGHASEGALDDLAFDRVIVNDGTLAELEAKVRAALDASSIVCDS